MHKIYFWINLGLSKTKENLNELNSNVSSGFKQICVCIPQINEINLPTYSRWDENDIVQETYVVSRKETILRCRSYCECLVNSRELPVF